MVIVDIEAALLPLLPARVEDPETHYVLEKANGSECAALVGEVAAVNQAGDERAIPFNSDK